MSDEKKDFIPGQFPESLTWTQDGAIESLEKLRGFVVNESDRAVRWYFAKRKSKRILGYTFRSGAIVTLGISGLIPVLGEILKSSGVPGISPAWATVALAVAAVLVSFDHFGGWTTSWIRYLRAGQKLSKLQSDFLIEWEKYRLTTSDCCVDPAVLQEGMEKCRKFLGQVHSEVGGETNQWAQEFQRALIQVDKKTESK